MGGRWLHCYKKLILVNEILGSREAKDVWREKERPGWKRDLDMGELLRSPIMPTMCRGFAKIVDAKYYIMLPEKNASLVQIYKHTKPC